MRFVKRGDKEIVRGAEVQGKTDGSKTLPRSL